MRIDETQGSLGTSMKFAGGSVDTRSADYTIRQEIEIRIKGHEEEIHRLRLLLEKFPKELLDLPTHDVRQALQF